MVEDPMRSEVDDWEDRHLDVTRTAEAAVGEDRFGGCWIDFTSQNHPSLWIAIVDPSEDDVEKIQEAALAVRWRVQLQAVRHSRVELIRWLEGMEPDIPRSDALLGIGWDARLNA